MPVDYDDRDHDDNRDHHDADDHDDAHDSYNHDYLNDSNYSHHSNDSDYSHDHYAHHSDYSNHHDAHNACGNTAASDQEAPGRHAACAREAAEEAGEEGRRSERTAAARSACERASEHGYAARAGDAAGSDADWRRTRVEEVGMDTLQAAALGEANRGKELRVFDWDRAAEIIVERKAQEASAGLSQDWEWTGGPIFRDGKPIPAEDTYVYLASTWATPELEIDGEIIDCYRMKSETPDWDSGTYWPESALAIIGRGCEG